MSDVIHQEVTFDASAAQVYAALMDQDRHAAFTGGAAEIDAAAGGAFSCHDGQIVGRTIELEPDRRIVQAWRVAAWPPGVYSVVRFELEEQEGRTRLTLDQSGVPAEGRDRVAAGWEARYWQPMRSYLTR